MFEIKYDSAGQPIRNLELEKQLEVDNAALEQNPEQPEVSEENTNNIAPEQTEPPKVIEPIAEAQESSAERNYRRLREDKEKAERERDELLRYMQTSQQPKAEEENLELDLEPDALAEGKHLSKVYKKMRLLENQLAQTQKQNTEIAIENRLKTEYPDFGSVVNDQNLKLLSEDDPDLMETVTAYPDLYKKAVVVYRAIKRLGIAKEQPKYNTDKDLINKNIAKPRSVNSVSPQKGDSPLHVANAFANGLTEDMKAQLNKEMNDAIKNH